MNFEEIVIQFLNGDIEKEEFVKQAKDRIDFLENECIEAYLKRDAIKKELKALKDHKKENDKIETTP